MFEDKANREPQYKDLCIVYYVIDNPNTTTNLVMKHFRLKV